MIGPSLSAIIATIGRPTLEQTLDSILAQALLPGDEIIIVRDSLGDPDDTQRVAVRVFPYIEQSNGIIQYREHAGTDHFYGVAQHNAVWRELTADYILSFGDDDILCDGAWARLRDAIGEERARVVLFQWMAPWREVLWDKRELIRSRVSGSCMAAPRPSARDIPAERYIEADFDWMVQTVEATRQGPLWVEDVIVIARPELREGRVASLGPTRCTQCQRIIFREDAVDGVCVLCRTPKVAVFPVAASSDPQRIVLVWPAAEVSVSDVTRGYRNALVRAGHTVIDFKLNNRFKYHAAALRSAKQDAELDLSRNLDLLSREATEGIAAFVLRHNPHQVIIIAGLSFHPDGLFYLQRLGVPTTAIFTESPYNDEQQRAFAAIYPGMQCTTNDRTSAEANGWTYLPPSYDQSVHHPVPPSEEFGCDVFMCGTGWPERQALLEGVDWDGIDVRIYGHWPTVKPGSPLYRHVRWAQDEAVLIRNEAISHAYASAKVCLNIHRTGEASSSVNPRCLEVAACRGFLLTDDRPGLREMFGNVDVPTFDGVEDLGRQLRRWLKDDVGRRRVAKQLQAAVENETFDARVQTLMHARQPQLV